MAPAPQIVGALPFSDEFLAFWARQGPVNHSWGQTRTASAAAAKRSRTCSLSARHNAPRPAHAPISRMRVRARHRCLQHAMGAAAEVLAQDAEREQQREAGQVESVGATAAPRAASVRQGADGVEQRAARAAHEVEGDDGDEAMEGDENISLQRAEGGNGLAGGIKKKKPKRRSKVEKYHVPARR